MILWILGGILLLLFLLVACICLLPIYLRLYSDEAGDLKFDVQVLWLHFPGEKKEPAPAKAAPPPKKEKVPKADTPKKDNAFLKQLGLSDYTSAENIKKSISEKGLIATISNFCELLKPVFSALGRLTKRLRVRRLRLRLVTAGENAAMDYGKACAILYPLGAFAQSRSFVKNGSVKMDIGCDYSREKAEFGYDLVIRIFVGNILRVGLKLLFSLLKGGKHHG